MSKLVLPAEILSISGAMGKMLYKTYTKADGSTETRVYSNPYYRPRGEKYKRRIAYSDNERRAQRQFAEMSREVSRRVKAGDCRLRELIWADVKREFAEKEE